MAIFSKSPAGKTLSVIFVWLCSSKVNKPAAMRNLLFFGFVFLVISCSKQVLLSGTNKKHAGADTLQFSGYTWVVRESNDGKQGPGPNRWKGANAFVDSQGYLHLLVSKVGDNWYCAEVTSKKKFGYGTYQWDVESKFDTLDKNIILGLFNYSGIDGRDEMDIELGRWAKDKFDNTSYTIYPAQDFPDKSNWNKTFNTTLTSAPFYTTQRFTWKDNKSVFFQELSGFHDDDSNLIDSVTCYNPPHSISSLPMPVHMNFWLFESGSPSNNMPAEVIIHSFKFISK
jgi:hypothetical protein